MVVESNEYHCYLRDLWEKNWSEIMGQKEAAKCLFLRLVNTVNQYNLEHPEHAKRMDDFETIGKNTITNSAGVRYTEFKTRLKPRYFKIWTDITFGYIFLIAVLAVATLVQLKYPKLFYLTIPVLAILAGYAIAYIHLFIHEAAHFNIAPDRKQNDKLANIFVGLIVGMNIKFYRATHFNHHRYLGTVKDPEKTYFDALSKKFILESLTGIRVIKVLINRNNQIKKHSNFTPEIIAGNIIMLVAGGIFNLIILVTLFAVGLWQVGLIWFVGIGVVFPFFAALRQLLEHRHEDAESSIDYHIVDHGIRNRLFGEGIIANTMGGAGFNRHILHHWDPQVSYTRLKDVESFLADTPLASTLQNHRTSYFETFIKLFKK